VREPVPAGGIRVNLGRAREQLQRGLLVGTLLAVALALAACSSSGSSSAAPPNGASSTTSTTTTRPAATSTTTTPKPAKLATCTPSQLSVAVQPGSGAAGTVYASATMTNSSSAKCSLGGYPGMQLLSASGAAIPTDVIRGGGTFLVAQANQPATIVTLAPGQAVAFSFFYGDNPVGKETSCPTSAKVEITPPNDYTYAVVTARITACGGGAIHVSPVYPAQ